MNERDTFIRAIAEAWDDPTPVLVFADWAEEHGTDDPALLRWYGWHVMPALAAVPNEFPAASDAERSKAYKVLRAHPQADILSRLAAVAFCRRPMVWNRVGAEPFRATAEVARLFSIGLATDIQRTARLNLDRAAARTAGLNRAIQASTGYLLATYIPDAAGPAVALMTQAGGSGSHPTAHGFQTAIYTALAAVPPLRIDAAPPPDVQEVVKRERPLPPMKLPRGKFRRIVVRGRAYGWQARTGTHDWRDEPIEIVVRSADNTGQRLRVRPAPRVVLPGLVARIMGDALEGGWQPSVSDLPDFPWDGTPYLPPA